MYEVCTNINNNIYDNDVNALMIVMVLTVLLIKIILTILFNWYYKQFS